MDNTYLIGAIALAALMTYITRVTPFLFFRKKEPSAIIKYIEWNMPVMIMVILVFYALKDVKWDIYPFGLAEIVCIIIAAFVHVKYKNALLSIFLATIAYMILIQKIL
jgi:branched-subunit amino acid transport protein AzlD